MSHPAAHDLERLLADCDVRFTRRSGPGGQNRNKVETAVVLTHRPTGLVAEATLMATREGRAWLSASALESHRDLGVLRSAGFRARGEGTAVTVYARATEPWAASVLSPGGWYLTGGDPDL